MARFSEAISIYLYIISSHIAGWSTEKGEMKDDLIFLCNDSFFSFLSVL